MNIHELLQLISDQAVPGTQTKAGPIDGDTFAERAAAYEEEMQFLHAAGADYSGQEGWRSLMSRLGRPGGRVENAVQNNLSAQERSEP